MILAAELFDKLLSLVLELDEFVLSFDHKLMVGFFFLEDVDDEGRWIKVRVPELIFLGKELFDLIPNIK